MLMSRKHREHPTKWQPCGAMYGGVCASGMRLLATNNFGGRLGRRTSIDSRQSGINSRERTPAPKSQSKIRENCRSGQLPWEA